MNYGVVGAGKVGCSLGKFLSLDDLQITGYYSRSLESAKEAAKFTQSKYFESIETLVNKSDAIFITVPDQAIRSVFEQICQCEIKNKFICHCSGALSSTDVFQGIERTGAHGFCVHPLFPINSRFESYRELTDAFFCFEGDEKGIDIFEPILQSKGAKTMRISPEVKCRYHIACVTASNFMCGLIRQSMDFLNSCGFSDELSLQVLTPLLRSNLEHLILIGPERALTGPVVRGDADTIRKHLHAMDEKERDIYSVLSTKLCEMAITVNPQKSYTKILNLLQTERKLLHEKHCKDIFTNETRRKENNRNNCL